MNKQCIFLLLILMVSACTQSEWQRDYPESFDITLANNSDHTRTDAVIVLDVAEIREHHPDFNPCAFVVTSDHQEWPSQSDDLDGDDERDEIVLVADFAPREQKRVTIHFAPEGERMRPYPKRTQAELSHKVGGAFVGNEGNEYEGGTFQNVRFVRVPDEHTDHSTYFRYEGPGWESDKVGYRFYLDWRNAIDIFGKKIPEMVLHTVGLDGFVSYHEMADWGMDILKVGESLGVGSIAMWHGGRAERVAQTDSVTCEIVADGPVRSLIRTRYFGWQVGAQKCELTSELSITAGSRLTRHDVTISGQPSNLCTGLAKHKAAEVLLPAADHSGWGYLALYGRQSLAGDNLGTAVLYRTADLIEITEDDFSHVVVLAPKEGKLAYYFLAAWEQEPHGIKAKQAFMDYLNRLVLELNNPIKAHYQKTEAEPQG